MLPSSECTLILGNPPFVGAKYQEDRQRAEMRELTQGIHGAGLLDYVTGWYLLGARYIKGTTIPIGFVSTNSISQGEQVGVLWGELFKQGISIYFAHRTFAWESEARGKAHVHVVIVGFGTSRPKQKWLFDYEDIRGEPTASTAMNISPYLVEGPDVAIANRSRPLGEIPEIGIGNKPIDDGNYLFTDDEKKAFVKQEPASKPYFKRWYGSREFINSSPRWCLWIGDCEPDKLRSMPLVMQRVEAVRQFRLESKSAPTQRLAQTPTRFHVENFPKGNYLLIPEVSSERRSFIPMGFMSDKVICSNLVKLMPKATPYHFGVLSSTMHMAWVRYVAGRLESRYRYSAKLVYNNFPWPVELTDKKQQAVETAAQAVLEARKAHPTATLADLYDPLSMPANLTKAHAKLDHAVDKCYRSHPFANEQSRVEYLFKLYQQLTTPLLPAKATKRKKP